MMRLAVMLVATAVIGVIGGYDQGHGGSGLSSIQRAQDAWGNNRLSYVISALHYGDFHRRWEKRGAWGEGISNYDLWDPVGYVRSVQTVSGQGGTRQVIVGSPLGRYEDSPFYSVRPGPSHHAKIHG